MENSDIDACQEDFDSVAFFLRDSLCIIAMPEHVIEIQHRRERDIIKEGVFPILFSCHFGQVIFSICLPWHDRCRIFFRKVTHNDQSDFVDTASLDTAGKRVPYVMADREWLFFMTLTE